MEERFLGSPLDRSAWRRTIATLGTLLAFLVLIGVALFVTRRRPVIDLAARAPASAVNRAELVCLVAYAAAHAMPLAEIIPLVLTAVLASIPVALPATFTLAAAGGARSLAHRGVLPTRLSAVDEAASIDVLCADKTGTLTRNELTVTTVHSAGTCRETSRAAQPLLFWPL